MDVRAEKSWTSTPKSAFSCGPGGGEKLFEPWASGRKRQECPAGNPDQKVYVYAVFFFPETRMLNSHTHTITLIVFTI